MELCLSHWSALECWRRIRKIGIDITSTVLETRTVLPKKFGSIATPQELIDLRRNYNLTGDVECLVNHRSKRHVRPGSVIFCCPKGVGDVEVCEIEPGLYVVTPEVLFRQLSSELDTLGLVALGYELCSQYTFDIQGNWAKSISLTSLEKLCACSFSFARADRGSRALCYVWDNSASPKETEFSMKVGLSTHMGGFGFKRYLLNSEVELSESAKEIAGKSKVYPDMLFAKSKTVFEYNGEEEHAGAEKRQEDELRRLALTNDGYNVEVITKKQLRSRSEMLKIANKISVAEKGRAFKSTTKHMDSLQNGLFASIGNKVHVKRGSDALVNSY